jgi:heme-degrading monooxygenase HmoA
MMRVVYRWQVETGKEEVFAKAWAIGTKAIRSKITGARGSLLLQKRTDPPTFVGIARWLSLEDWQAFRRGKRPSPAAFRAAGEVSTMLSVETFNEVRDLRVFKTSEMGTAQATAAKSVKSAKPEKKRKKTKQ